MINAANMLIVTLGMIGISLFAVQLLFCLIAKVTAKKRIPQFRTIFFGLFLIVFYSCLFGIGRLDAIQILRGYFESGTMSTTIVLGTISLVFFVIQLRLCFKIRITAKKLIPTYILLLLMLFVCLLYMGMFGTSGGSIPANQLFALPLALRVGPALVGNVIAWITYGITLKYKISLIGN